MNPESARELLRRQPFEPFEVHLSNGERHPIRQPENPLVTGSRMVIAYPETDRIIVVSLLHINTYEMLQPAA